MKLPPLTDRLRLISAARVDPMEKLALFVLNEFMNVDTGSAWASYANIAIAMGCSRRTVLRSIKSLCDRGFIGTEARFREGRAERTSNLIFINWEHIGESGDAQSLPAVDDLPCGDTESLPSVLMSPLSDIQAPPVVTESHHRSDTLSQQEPSHVNPPNNPPNETIDPPSPPTGEIVNSQPVDSGLTLFGDEPERQTPKAKGRRRSRDAQAANVATPKLLEVLNAWNSLPPGITPKVNLDQIAGYVFDHWKKLDTDAGLRACFDDVPALMEAVKKSTTRHGDGYFTFAWLFSKDPLTKEWRAQTILQGKYFGNPNGGYRNDRNKPRTGGGVSYDPNTVSDLDNGTYPDRAG